MKKRYSRSLRILSVSSCLGMIAASSILSLNSCGPAPSTGEQSESQSESPNGEGGDPNTAPESPESPETSGPVNNPYQPTGPATATSGEKNFAKLINQHLEGRPDHTPWVGPYWPYTKNGIADGSFSRGLSPAGKYDAARGGRTKAQEWEVKNHGARVRGVQGWWGHCNGWCVAASLFSEPREPAVVNGVHFSPGDIKALLTEAGMSASADFFGTRVDWASDFTTPKVDDTVPAQFFLVLTTYIGQRKQSVLIDRHTTHEVWNQPVAGYRFEYPKPSDYLGTDPAAPGVHRIMMTATIWWSSDFVTAETLTEPFNFPAYDTEHYQQRTLKMEIWLDAPPVWGPDGKLTSSGDVIVTRKGDYFVGGVWRMGEGLTDQGWPDYMWVPYSVVKPTDPAQDYVNFEVDIQWIKDHLLVPGGRDDISASPSPIIPAPSISPSGLPSTLPSGFPTGLPSGFPSRTPTPTITPTVTPTVRPTVTPTSEPSPAPTSRPTLTPPPPPPPPISPLPLPPPPPPANSPLPPPPPPPISPGPAVPPPTEPVVPSPAPVPTRNPRPSPIL